MTTRVSLAELATAGFTLRPAEAVAIVADICRQFTDGGLQGLPSPGLIRLTRDGQIAVHGPIATDAASVAAAAHLLEELLPAFEAPGTERASGGLRLVIARGLGTLDLPPYDRLDEFRIALERFAVPDLAAAARTLFHAWEEDRARPGRAPDTPALSVSDIRRARRATGLTLDDLSAVADVPASRLCELEWGYFRHWQADERGRAGVLRYARAAGLDEHLVLSIAWPMIEEAAAIDRPEAVPVTARQRSEPQALATIAPAPQPRGPWGLISWAVAGIAAALLALATFTSAVEPPPTGETRTEVANRSAAPAPAPAKSDLPEVVPAVDAAAPPVALVPAATSSSSAAGPRPSRAGKPVPRAAAPKRRPESRNRSFFSRELFRIVIK